MGPMPPKQGMSKGLLWSLIGGGIGVFVLIIIIIYNRVYCAILGAKHRGLPQGIFYDEQLRLDQH